MEYETIDEMLNDLGVDPTYCNSCEFYNEDVEVNFFACAAGDNGDCIRMTS